MKILKYILVIIGAMLFGIMLDRYICNKALVSLKSEFNKFESFFSILEQWLSNKQSDIKLEEYLASQKYFKVAIYGMGVLGNLLYQELSNTGIQVSYAIDRNGDEMYFEVPVFNPSDEYDEVDAIIVTAILDYEKIRANIKKKTHADVISLEDVIYGAAEM